MYSYNGENISQGRDNAILYLKENADVIAKVEAELTQKLIESGAIYNRSGIEGAAENAAISNGASDEAKDPGSIEDAF